VGQHVKGKAQQAVGAIQKKVGYPVQGTINQIKGTANVAVAEAKSKLENSK
jgi:uncharacterized protein YjbJ (UPF0337 family)